MEITVIAVFVFGIMVGAAAMFSLLWHRGMLDRKTVVNVDWESIKTGIPADQKIEIAAQVLLDWNLVMACIDARGLKVIHQDGSDLMNVTKH